MIDYLLLFPSLLGFVEYDKWNLKTFLQWGFPRGSFWDSVSNRLTRERNLIYGAYDDPSPLPSQHSITLVQTACPECNCIIINQRFNGHFPSEMSLIIFLSILDNASYMMQPIIWYFCVKWFPLCLLSLSLRMFYWSSVWLRNLTDLQCMSSFCLTWWNI